MYMFHKNRTLPPNTLQADGKSPEWIWVFGSNLAGRHGAGAAKVALDKFQARLGVGYGREGLSFALPTKDEHLESLPIMGASNGKNIQDYVRLFKAYARHRMDAHEKFFVTAIGTELAGYTHEQIAPLFVGSPDNCSFPEEWRPFLDPEGSNLMASAMPVDYDGLRSSAQRRFFYHPESDSLMVTEDGTHPGTDGLLEELTAQQYAEKQDELTNVNA